MVNYQFTFGEESVMYAAIIYYCLFLFIIGQDFRKFLCINRLALLPLQQQLWVTRFHTWLQPKSPVQ